MWDCSVQPNAPFWTYFVPMDMQWSEEPRTWCTEIQDSSRFVPSQGEQIRQNHVMTNWDLLDLRLVVLRSYLRYSRCSNHCSFKYIATSYTLVKMSLNNSPIQFVSSMAFATFWLFQQAIYSLGDLLYRHCKAILRIKNMLRTIRLVETDGSKVKL